MERRKTMNKQKKQNDNENYLEDPFKYLIRKEDGSDFSQDIVNNWYKARAYVLNKLKNIGFTPISKDNLHVVIHGDSPMMLSIVRQVALSAHYLNYDEEKRKKRTVITLESSKPDIKSELEKEECLCTLPKYCKTTFWGEEYNNDSYIDIEIEVVEKSDKKGETSVDIYENDVVEFIDNLDKTKHDEIYKIDTRKARCAHEMYELGDEINNLPYEDIYNVKRYEMALDTFQLNRMKKALNQKIVKDTWKDKNKQIEVLKGLSNIFCADCFYNRYISLEPLFGEGKDAAKKAFEKYYYELSKSEHARWVVEKLILGYSPYSQEDHYNDENNFVSKVQKKQFRDALKTDWKSPKHVNICSFSDLRRIDPDNMKYDSFLMLGIPEILKKVDELPKKQDNGSKNTK